MRTQRYLPRIQNGPVAKRHTRPGNSSISKSFAASKSSSRRNSNRAAARTSGRRSGAGRGARVIWTMILIGTALAAGFVFALRSQINAHKLGQAEEQLRVKLDEYAGQQKFLMLDQQRALNTSESDRAGREGGLDQLKLVKLVKLVKLDQPGTLRNASIQKVVQQVSTPFRPSQAGQQNRVNSNRLSKQPAPNNQVAKLSAKNSKNPALKANVAKFGAAKTKAKKEGVKQQQAARSQKKR